MQNTKSVNHWSASVIPNSPASMPVYPVLWLHSGCLAALGRWPGDGGSAAKLDRALPGPDRPQPGCREWRLGTAGHSPESQKDRFKGLVRNEDWRFCRRNSDDKLLHFRLQCLSLSLSLQRLPINYSGMRTESGYLRFSSSLVYLKTRAFTHHHYFVLHLFVFHLYPIYYLHILLMLLLLLSHTTLILS